MDLSRINYRWILAAGGLVGLLGLKRRRPIGTFLGFAAGMLTMHGLEARESTLPINRRRSERRPGSSSFEPSREGAVPDTGWAPESGEPSETRLTTRGRPFISSEAGETEELAPESGGRSFEKYKSQATRNAETRESDSVDEASEESFPASDAPSWTPSKI